MKRQHVRAIVLGLSEKIAAIQDENTKAVVSVLLNVIELQADEIDRLTAENQLLRDEVNRLKGEQGKPTIRPQSRKAAGGDDDDKDDPGANLGNHSSERERSSGKKSKKNRKRKKPNLTIHKHVVCPVDTSTLPEDAVLKSYESVIIQDLPLTVQNIQFRRAVYYSPSLQKTFSGKLPPGYVGDYGPGVRTLILQLYHDGKMTQDAIVRFLNTAGVHIAASTVARLLTEGHDDFHHEKDAIVMAGFASTDYQHIDDTGSRVHGKNHYVTILSNPYYTAYFTLPKKDRLSIISLLCQGEMRFDLTEESLALMGALHLPKPHIDALRGHAPERGMGEQAMRALLQTHLPNPKKHESYRRIIREACAIAAYRQRDDAIACLIADDAPQFKKITTRLGLCWVHEGRHYKKLNPITPHYRTLLDNFIEQFWAFYRELRAYKQQPTAQQKEQLSGTFDKLFTQTTDYDALNQCIARTANKKAALLLVLDYPHLPLHNNDAELGARVQARIRDIHLHTMSQLGTQAKDTFATIAQTARKLGVNLYDYLFDRVAKTYQMPSLARCIQAQRE